MAGNTVVGTKQGALWNWVAVWPLVNKAQGGAMKYVNNGPGIAVGDSVLVEGDIRGVVICDFDNWQCLTGYEGWLTKEEMVGGGFLSSGVLIETAEIGIVHYALRDAEIALVARAEADPHP